MKWYITDGATKPCIWVSHSQTIFFNVYNHVATSQILFSEEDGVEFWMVINQNKGYLGFFDQNLYSSNTLNKLIIIQGCQPFFLFVKQNIIKYFFRNKLKIIKNIFLIYNRKYILSISFSMITLWREKYYKKHMWIFAS